VGNAEAFSQVQQVTNAYSEVDPATGGFLVPEETRSTLLQLALEQSVVRSRASVITMGSLTTSIPFVDATTHVGSVFGGMVFYWVGEGASITPTEAKFGRVKLEANKLVGGARVPNELWSDAPALSTWLEMAAPMGIAYYEDVACITGNGVGQPLGILNAPAKIQSTRANADELEPADIYSMYARMLPQSLGSAVWLVNQTALPAIFALHQKIRNDADNDSVGGFGVGILDISATPFMTLLGRPMIVTEKVPALGATGGDDVAFVDFRYYLLGDRQAVSLDYSEHSRFMNDETELRIIERVDGRPWVQSALTPLNGDTVSPIVTLEEGS
jgi:HK97 family phage major capsid protein